MNFPRTRHLNASYEIQDKELGFPSAMTDKNCTFLSHQEIINTITSAKRDAYIMILSLGMSVDITKADDIQIRNLKVNINNLDDIDIQEDSDEEEGVSFEQNKSNCEEHLESEEVLQDLTIVSNISGTLELRDYSETNVQMRPDSPFTIVTDSHGKEHIVRKSLIC